MWFNRFDLFGLKINEDFIILIISSHLTKRKKLTKLILGGGTSLLLIIGGVSYSKIWPWEKEVRDLSSYTTPAKKGKLPGLVDASGELKAVRTVNVSPERQGILEQLLVEEGDRVIKGQIIARMESGDYKYRLSELKAEYQKQKIAFLRRKELFAEGAISAEQYEDYRNRFLTSKARLKQREIEGKELTIRAPFSGLITTRYAEPGAYVAPATRASSLAGSSSSSIVELSEGLEVSAKVPESDLGRIKIGQFANIRVDAFPDKRFKSQVIEIAPRASKTDNVTSFEVTLSLINSPKILRIGMNADIEFMTGETEERTLVPTVAIVTENGKPGVLTVGKNNQPLFQSVQLGESSGSQTAILEGLKPDDLIFINLPPWAKQSRN